MKTGLDHIIVGQGIAGSALALELHQRGKRILMIDQHSANRASKISAGIFNPITGKVMGLTYKAADLFPFLHGFYGNAERKFRSKFFHPMPLYRPFVSTEEFRQWKAKQDHPFIKEVSEDPWHPDLIRNRFGGLLLEGSGYLDVEKWMSAVREMLIAEESYLDEKFVEADLEVGDSIVYRGRRAANIIFADGIHAKSGRWFNWLPLKALKGEVLTIGMQNTFDRLISRGVYMVPGREQHTFTVGSTYEHEPFEEDISERARVDLETRLQTILSASYTVLHQDWGIRPTVTDRRPLLGAHPDNRNVIIFNGMGTKGVSLAPYFAKCLADWMDDQGDLPAEVNIYRFKSLYSR